MSNQCIFRFTEDGEKFMQSMDELKDMSAKVGFVGNKAAIAMFFEYGTSKIQARPFMTRAYHMDKKTVLENVGADMSTFIEKPTNANDLMESAAEQVKINIEAAIENDEPTMSQIPHTHKILSPLKGMEKDIVISIGKKEE
ncbi:MAG: hypothetical protein LUD47_07605 [Clostridia bacterium]|nr:hypothetical protein [Clostridia bacterium]